MHERLIIPYYIGYPGIYSLSVKRRGFTDKCIFLILVDSIIEIITEKG